MGFRQGAYARVWSMDDKGKFCTCRMSISRKNKKTGSYDTEFQDGYVRFVGTAYNMIKAIPISDKGLNIKLASCDVTNYFERNGKKYFNPQFTVFGFELADGESATPTGQAQNAYDPMEDLKSVSADEEELPFD